ncbi:MULTISPECIES: hypothetical protein [unclassified Brevundimonas]
MVDDGTRMTAAVYKRRSLPSLYGRVIFAEDARIEMGGQFSLIGCIPVGLAEASFPATMAKLAILVEITTAWDLEPKELVLKVFLPGAAEDAPLIEMPIEMRSVEKASPEEQDGPYPGEQIIRHFVLNVHPNVVLQQPGEIRVRVFYGDEYVAIGSLPVKLQEEPDASVDNN